MSLLFTLGGHYVWRRNTPNLKLSSSKTPDGAMFGLSGLVFATLLVGYLGMWIVGTLFVAISVLLIGVILGRYVFDV